jgi:pimeloyl-ACP methyl ester carboxylesterase
MKRFIFRPLGYLLIGVLSLVVVGTAGLLAYRTYKQSEVRQATRIETPNGIESLDKIEVNGSKQWIYIRGHDRANPILLFVHGGPGMPEMAMARYMGQELEKHYTVVHWDQRASGRSRREKFDEADLTLETYLDDTLDVVNYLRRQFEKEKIYLIGHSWGSILGTLTVRDHPELFHAYIGMGQVVNMVRNEEVSLEFVLEQARAEGNTEALSELEGLSPPYEEDPSELGIQRRWLTYYGGSMKGLTYPDLGNIMMYSPEYGVRDFFAMFRGMTSLAPRMWPELASIDLIEQAPNLDVPVYFFVGRYDYNTPFSLTQAYHDLLEAPSKEMVWFENSAHFMNISDPDFYQDRLINKVLAETR